MKYFLRNGSSKIPALTDVFFSAYRFVTRLEEILIESGFSDGAPIPDELNSLVVVMLWELAERRFLLRGTRSKSALVRFFTCKFKVAHVLS